MRHPAFVSDRCIRRHGRDPHRRKSLIHSAPVEDGVYSSAWLILSTTASRQPRCSRLSVHMVRRCLAQPRHWLVENAACLLRLGLRQSGDPSRRRCRVGHCVNRRRSCDGADPACSGTAPGASPQSALAQKTSIADVGTVMPNWAWFKDVDHLRVAAQVLASKPSSRVRGAR